MYSPQHQLRDNSIPAPSAKATPDPQLWQRFKSGDEHAFSRIFHENYGQLYRYGIRLTADPDLVKDCIQELFITLWNSRERLGIPASIRFYLLKSLRRSLIRQLSATSSSAKIPPREYDFQMEFSPEASMIAGQLCQEQQEHLQKALNELSPRQKEVIYLRFYNGLSYDEIAELTSLNYQSIRNYVHQAIIALRKKKQQFISLLSGLAALFLL
jgi:RNA polymerase sigma factor (sigma-70 family)